MPEGMYYNAAYSGHMIAMPQPLYGDDVDYLDGADTSMDAVARDLVNFMAWTAEPALRKTQTHRCCRDDLLSDFIWVVFWGNALYLGRCEKTADV